MYWEVTEVQLKKHLNLYIKFIDGIEGTVSFTPSHLTGIFEPLKDESFFAKVYIDNDTISWPGGIDIAPDTMYDALKTYGSLTLD